ncbi:helicase-like protein [Tanacetum coccineum]
MLATSLRIPNEHYRSVAVERLPFHEEGCNRVYFRGDDDADNVIQRETAAMSKFTEWMKAKEMYPELGSTLNFYHGLNPQQRDVYDNIVQAVNERNGGLFFLYGCGGTEKTYLWKTIISWIRSVGRIVLSVASSGIASLLLPGGRTAHSRFHIPMELDNESCCGIDVISDLADLIRVADLIIWDEAPLQH